MKTQIELITHYTKNLEKVIGSHGLDSDYTNYAFYLLQAVKINVAFDEIFNWAENKCSSLYVEALALAQLNSEREKNIEFDDLVIEENGMWTQVCEECSKRTEALGVLVEIPINGLICGVKDCKNEAVYYLNFNSQRESESSKN